MIEPYVGEVMDVIEKECKARNVHEGSFWAWLGNVKFKEDNGNLTPERAKEIIKRKDELFKKWGI